MSAFVQEEPSLWAPLFCAFHSLAPSHKWCFDSQGPIHSNGKGTFGKGCFSEPLKLYYMQNVLYRSRFLVISFKIDGVPFYRNVIYIP